MLGIDPNQAILFFGTLIEQMLKCPPNYGPASNKSKGHSRAIPNNVHILKGFYPGTTQMFKITIIDRMGNFIFNIKYEIYVSEPKIHLTKNRFNIGVSAEQIQQHISSRMEESLLGTEPKELEPFFKPEFMKTLNAPRCISPKGMPLFKLSKKKG